MLKKFRDVCPKVHSSAFIAETAVVIGNVEIAENANIWYGVVARGDINRIVIGKNTNIQENTVIHVDRDTTGEGRGCTIIGSDVTVGHKALLHACRIGDGCLIGMNAVVLSGAEIGAGSIVAAGAVVLENKKIPPGSLVVGLPAVVKCSVPPERQEKILESARHYVELAREHKNS